MKENKTKTIRLNNPEGMKMTFEEKKEPNNPLQQKVVLQEKPSPEKAEAAPTQEAKKVESVSQGVSKEDFNALKESVTKLNESVGAMLKAQAEKKEPEPPVQQEAQKQPIPSDNTSPEERFNEAPQAKAEAPVAESTTKLSQEQAEDWKKKFDELQSKYNENAKLSAQKKQAFKE